MCIFISVYTSGSILIHNNIKDANNRALLSLTMRKAESNPCMFNHSSEILDNEVLHESQFLDQFREFTSADDEREYVI